MEKMATMPLLPRNHCTVKLFEAAPTQISFSLTTAFSQICASLRKKKHIPILIPIANDATDKANAGNDVVLMLSDRCPYTSQIALFSSGFLYTSIRREEFTGSIGTQFQNIIDYVMRLNAIQSRFVGVDRIDHYDYPPAALREALALVFVYRNYHRLTPLRIKIFPDRIECVCLGHFPTQYVRENQEFSEGARIVPPLLTRRFKS